MLKMMARLRPLWALALACVAVAAGPARAEWLRAESPHFIVYGDVSESDMRNYVRKVERFDALLRFYFPVQSDIEVPPLSVYLADGRDDMRKIWPNMPSQVGGFYTPGEARVFAVTGGRGVENDHTLFHEYAHHFMQQYLTAAYPAWFVEGFAEYFATADLTPSHMRVGLHSPGRMNSLTLGANAWLPMATVLRSRSQEIGNRGHLYYAQSWALTNYLMSTPERRAMLGRYLAAVMNGQDPLSSVQATMGVTPEQLGAAVRSYIGGPILFLSQDHEFAPVEVEVTRLPASARDLIWLDLRLSRFVPEERRAANLAEAQRAVDRYPGDPLAARVLSQALMDLQRDEEAVQALDAVVAANPDDAPSLLMQADALMEAGDAAAEADPARKTDYYRRARANLARAYEADPLDYRIYIALSKTREDASGYPTENDLQTLLLGTTLAPQVQSLRLRAAQALMARGQYADAVRYLAPVANNPHGGDSLQPIRALLAEAREKAGMAPANVEDAPSTADAGDGDDNSSEPDA